jgi:hypothetical protein
MKKIKETLTVHVQGAPQHPPDPSSHERYPYPRFQIHMHELFSHIHMPNIHVYKHTRGKITAQVRKSTQAGWIGPWEHKSDSARRASTEEA